MSLVTIHATASQHVGGAERFFARLTGMLCKDGDRTIAVVRRRSALRPLLSPCVAVATAGLHGGIDSLTRWRIRRLIRRERPRAIQTYMARATRLTHVPRRTDTLHVARVGGEEDLAAYRHADVWVGNTAGICEQLKRAGFPKDRVYLIGNFVDGVTDEVLATDPADARRRLGLPEDALIVFALGRFTQKKGFVDLLEAFDSVPKVIAGRLVMLVLAGTGPMRATLESAARQAGLGPRLKMPGWVEDTTPWFLAADVFVCPSRETALGTVVLEAWSHRRAVVATRAAGPAELITHGRDGVLVPTNDPGALAQALQRMLMEDEIREQIAKNGLVTVRRRHSLDAIVAQYRDLYERGTRRRGRSRAH